MTRDGAENLPMQPNILRFPYKPMANLYNAPKKFNKEYIDMIQILLISINK